MNKSMWILVCLLIAACSTNPANGWEEMGTDDIPNGDNGGGMPSGGSDASGNLLNFDVTLNDVADEDFIDATETVITDATNTEYEDFVENSAFSTVIRIAYTEGKATVTGGISGVSASTDGAYVTIHSTVAGVNYQLSGSTEDGALKIYSEKKFKLTLSGLTLTSKRGAAINIQGKKRIFIETETGTTNVLTDAAAYTNDVDGEDQKACFFSEGQLIFGGTGLLTVNGLCKHGICSDEYLRLRSGTHITVASAAKDAMHTNEKIIIGGGLLKLIPSGDGLDCEEGTVDIRGGLIKAQISGVASKGIKSTKDMTLSGGTLILLTSGGAEYDAEAKDINSAAGIKCDGNLTVNGSSVSIKSTGVAGKGINCDGTFTMTAGTLKLITTEKQYTYGSLDSSPKGLKADGTLLISDGTIWVRTIGGEGSEGIESKSTITINGGDIRVHAYDDCINASKGIDIHAGNVYCYSSGNDGIDSNGTLTLTGGTVITSGTTAPEEGFDCDQNTFKITGGVILGIGGSTSTPTSGVCTQRSVVYGGSGSNGTLLNVVTTDGTQVMSYTIPRNYQQMTVLFSSPLLTQNTNYMIYTGGSVSGGNTYCGLNTGGSYTKGTQVTSFTTNSMVTSVGTTSGGGGAPGGGGRW